MVDIPIEDSRQGSINLDTMSSRLNPSTSQTFHESSSSRVRFYDDNEIPSSSANNHQGNSIAKQQPQEGSPTSVISSLILSSSGKHKYKPCNADITVPSVFDRLSNTETVASLHQKFLPSKQSGTERRMKRSTSAPPSLRAKARTSKRDQEKKKTKEVKKEASNVGLFERLSGKHTALSKSRRKLRTELNNHNREEQKVKAKRSSSVGRRRTNRWMPIRDDMRKIEKTNRRAKYALKYAFDNESIGPPLEIEFSSGTKVMYSHKFMPENGFSELDLVELGLKPYLSKYEVGSISAKEFASEIMDALLWRNLPSTVHWKVDCPLERELAMPIGAIGFSFMIEATGQDHHVIEELSNNAEEEKSYTASATGNVTFLPDNEIHVENYSCVHDIIL